MSDPNETGADTGTINAARSTGRLLVVENEPFDAMSIRALLADAERPGPGTCVSSMAEALGSIQEHDITSVLLDLELPDSSGLEALEAILAAQPGIPVVVITRLGREALGLRAMSSGAQDYLVKGKVTGDLLLRTLEHAVERAEAENLRARLAAIVESSQDAIFSTSVDATVRSWNGGAERLYGYRADEIVGRSVFLLQPPERRMQGSQILARMAAGGPLEHFETRHLHKDGSPLDVSLQISPLVERGSITGVSTIARDISAQRRVEVALRESSERLAEAQRLAHIGSWSVDVRSGTRRWSDELYRLLGYEPGAFAADVGRVFARLHPDDADRVRTAILSQTSSTERWEGEFRIILPTGAQRWLTALMEPVLGPAGDVVGVHGTVQDITERKLAEERLRFQAHLLDAVGEAIVATDPAGVITYWGPGAERLYGWPAQEVMGTSVMASQPTAYTRAEAPEMMAGMASGDTWTGVLELQNRDGSTFIAEITQTRVVDDAGRMVGTIGISSDVSARVQASADLERARDQALEASVLKSQFLANMSHEIRTPMNGVLGMTELLLDTALDARQREFAETVRASGDALLTIINDILDLSKIEAGDVDLESIDFDLSSVIEDVADLLAGTAQSKGLELITDVADDIPALRGDPGRLRQVLTNLLGNAVKFTSHGHVVISGRVIDTTGAGTVVRLQVDDTGIGMNPEEAARVFEPFVQADPSTTRKYGGSGLGLSITRQIVELMGGHCGVDSEVGAGSSFWCVIALPPAHAAFAPQVPVSADILQGVRALVVDDNATNRVVLEGYLAGWGMDVDVAGSGATALDAALSSVADGRPFTLVVSDVHMPGMNGMELAAALRSDPATRSTPIVLLTSSGDDRDISPARPVGVSTMTKPVRRERLRRSLAEVVTGAQAEQPQTATPMPLTRAAAAGRGSVLLAEDNIINRKVATAMLESGGYSVDVAVDGNEALRAVRASRYDVVLMDCQMPQMDGYEATANIRAEEGPGRRLPIIAMTAGAMKEDRDRASAAGMDDYLSKPIRKADVLAAVGRWVGSA